jgi:hypothetical protein
VDVVSAAAAVCALAASLSMLTVTAGTADDDPSLASDFGGCSGDL